MKGKRSPTISLLNSMAAGIDIGGSSHFVAVPTACDKQPVREFGSFTTDLKRLVCWLSDCGITTVAMESTGVYWIPLYEMLEAKGFEVILVNARAVKNVPGRKSDVLDCQWLQQLHSYGLLRASFRPDQAMCQLRAFMRQRGLLIRYAAQHVQHAQKALALMNIQLTSVVSDVMGVTGLKIIRAILAGEHSPEQLASYRDARCKQSESIIAKSLEGHYREEHLFLLRQAIELYDIYQEKIAGCDREIEAFVKTLVPDAMDEQAKVGKEKTT